ncbi:MAG: DUF3598 family protein [Leptolyngbyaceae bacterium]|nr:DUF3598 family protein [Leptolyngbyaceae bacterium]
MPNQWDNLFKNEGTWLGSFTSLSPDGTVVSDTPSRLTLERTSDASARFQVTRYPTDAPPQATQTEFASINRASLFCEDGSFTKGSMQWNALAQFGTEFGLTLDNERLRLVQLFAPGGCLEQLVLIRETREGMAGVDRLPLAVDQLVGTWRGKAVTYFRDWYIADPVETEIAIAPHASGMGETWRTGPATGQREARLSGSGLLFAQDGIDYQMLLLPNGGWSLCPQQLQPRTTFWCELGWLTSPTTRLRLMRQYEADGSWAHQTWVTETKVA